MLILRLPGPGSGPGLQWACSGLVWPISIPESRAALHFNTVPYYPPHRTQALKAKLSRRDPAQSPGSESIVSESMAEIRDRNERASDHFDTIVSPA
jgi:hypothetical protein